MRLRRTPTAVDPGLALIDAYQCAIVQARMESLSAGDHTADVIEQERATVEALTGRVGNALRAEYLARQPR